MWVYMLDSASWVQPRAKPKSHSLSVGGMESLRRVLSSFRSLHSQNDQAQPSLSARSTAESCWRTGGEERSDHLCATLWVWQYSTALMNCCT